MGKRVGFVGFFGIALLVFLIWNDPHGAAHTDQQLPHVVRLT